MVPCDEPDGDKDLRIKEFLSFFVKKKEFYFQWPNANEFSRDVQVEIFPEFHFRLSVHCCKWHQHADSSEILHHVLLEWTGTKPSYSRSAECRSTSQDLQNGDVVVCWNKHYVVVSFVAVFGNSHAYCERKSVWICQQHGNLQWRSSQSVNYRALNRFLTRRIKENFCWAKKPWERCNEPWSLCSRFTCFFLHRQKPSFCRAQASWCIYPSDQIYTHFCDVCALWGCFVCKMTAFFLSRFSRALHVSSHSSLLLVLARINQEQKNRVIFFCVIPVVSSAFSHVGSWTVGFVFRFAKKYTQLHSKR